MKVSIIFRGFLFAGRPAVYQAAKLCGGGLLTANIAEQIIILWCKDCFGQNICAQGGDPARGEREPHPFRIKLPKHWRIVCGPQGFGKACAL
jgi:hypothetical protein